MSSNYFDLVKKEFRLFIDKFQENPFNFLTEYDLQSILYTKIFDNFESNNIKVSIETTVDDHSVRIFNPEGTISINPVRREYPASHGFDIAIIDDTELNPILSAYWHQKLKVAVELKYHRSSMSNSINLRKKGFEKDIQKLLAYCNDEKTQNKNFRGVALLFIQNIAEKKENDLEETFEELGYLKIENFDDVLFTRKVDGFVITGTKIFQINNT